MVEPALNLRDLKHLHQEYLEGRVGERAYVEAQRRSPPGAPAIVKLPLLASSSAALRDALISLYAHAVLSVTQAHLDARDQWPPETPEEKQTEFDDLRARVQAAMDPGVPFGPDPDVIKEYVPDERTPEVLRVAIQRVEARAPERIVLAAELVEQAAGFLFSDDWRFSDLVEELIRRGAERAGLEFEQKGSATLPKGENNARALALWWADRQVRCIDSRYLHLRKSVVSGIADDTRVPSESADVGEPLGTPRPPNEAEAHPDRGGSRKSGDHPDSVSSTSTEHRGGREERMSGLLNEGIFAEVCGDAPENVCATARRMLCQELGVLEDNIPQLPEEPAASNVRNYLRLLGILKKYRELAGK